MIINIEHVDLWKELEIAMKKYVSLYGKYDYELFLNVYLYCCWPLLNKITGI